ncbi:MAG: hypothetical protein AB1810_14085 [Pseudomonadota bacterium]
MFFKEPAITAPPTPQSGLDTIVAACLLASGLGFLIYIFATPIENTIYFFSDDAYYYFNVARNIVAGNGSSFDGYNLSNGYHPLWMLTILPIYYFTASSPELALKLILLLQTLLTIATFWMCWIFVSRQTTTHLGLIALLALGIFASPWVLAFNGLESSLVLCISFAILVLDRQHDFLSETAPTSTKLLLGVMLGLLVLARLDSAFVVIALSIYMLIFSHRRTNQVKKVFVLCREYLATIIAFFIVTAPYFIWNHTYFGHLSPISGMLKSSFPIPHISLSFNAGALPYLLTFAASIIWAAASLLHPNGYLRRILLSEPTVPVKNPLIIVFWLGCLIHVTWTLLFMQWGVYQWHFAFYIPALVLFLVAGAAKITTLLNNSPAIRLANLSMMSLAILGYSLLVYADKSSHLEYRYQAALWAKQHTAPTDTFALSDAGVFAYFSERSTINLDGLINSYEFQEAIKSHTLDGFFARKNLRYVADAYTKCDYDQRRIAIYAYPAKNLRQPIGYTITAQKEDEVFQGTPFLYRPLTEDREICFTIWDYADIDLIPR